MPRKAPAPFAGEAALNVPKLRLHKPSGRAVVTFNRRDVYCGKWRTKAATVEYDRVVGLWLANGRRWPEESTDLRIAELVKRYLIFAKRYYAGATGTGEYEPLCRALLPLARLFKRESVAKFGPMKLKALRQRWIDEERVRKQVNAAVQRVVRCFKWGVENELVPGEVYHALKAVAGLRYGRSEAKESQPVRPVAPAAVDAVLPFLTPPVRAMVEVQRLTGMRPGEVVQLTPAAIDCVGDVWTYRPPRHKTQHHGRQRVIYFGPRCQAVLAPFLESRAPDVPVFSPMEGLVAHLAKRSELRITPRNQGNRAGLRPKGRRPRSLNGRYDPEAYARAIARACQRAFPPPKPLARLKDETLAEWKARLGESGWTKLKTWWKAHHWHPNQLRHSFATEVRRAHGLETAQILLGHAKADVTQIYAERDASRAVAVAALMG